MKWLNIILLCGALCAVGCTKEESIIESGTAGDLTWTLLENGTLTISGKGAMPDYLSIAGGASTAPWYEYRDKISDLIIGNDITHIGNFAFWECGQLKSITIGSSVAAIGKCAFIYCSSLLSVNIPNSVVSIGEIAFFKCSSLSSVIIGNSVQFIGDNAFGNCAITSVTIPSSVISIGVEIFTYCESLESIHVENSNIAYSSENGVLYNRTKTTLIKYPAKKAGVSYTIPNSVTFIESAAFENCKELTDITIPNSVTTIERAAFVNCSGLTSVIIPNNISIINDFLFYYCTGLTSVIIPNSVISIGNCAFTNCRNLTSITIGSSASSFGTQAFSGCTGLSEIINQRSIPQTINDIGYYSNIFSGINKTTCTLFVPAGSEDTYRAADGWKDFVNIIAINAE